MRISGIVPLVGLTVVGFFAWRALFGELNFELPYERTPEEALDPGPELPFGDASLAGRLVGERDVPVVEALVSVQHGERVLWRYTDQEGRFRFEGVDAGEIQAYVVARGYPAFSRAVTAGGEEALVRMPPPHEGAPYLEGIPRGDLFGVIDLPGGGDPTGYEVALRPTSPPEELSGAVPRRAPVSSVGQFVFLDLAHGEYELTLLPVWARGGSWPDLLTELDGPPTILVHPRDAPGAQLNLRSSAGIITGVITDRRGVPGSDDRLEFVEGAFVWAHPAADDTLPAGRWRLWPVQSTDVDGVFRIGDLPPGRYKVVVASGPARIEREVTVVARSISRVDFESIGDR